MHTQSNSREVPVVAPRVDIYEGERDVQIVADVPGAAPGEVRVEFERGELVLDAPTPADHPFGAVRWRRSFTLGRTVATDGITAELKDGVLRVTLPRVDVPHKRTIEVAVG